MAWVRYDDQFYANPKVTAVIVEEPGALALHVLANTWTNGQKTPGYIPGHQAAVLLSDRGLAEKWAGVLVQHNLWHVRGQECDRCREEYADLPATATGWVIHDAKEYRAPARDRTRPGTPSELSEKRRTAGRLGGKAAAAKRQANGVANQANPNLLVANQVANGQAKPTKRTRKAAAAKASSPDSSRENEADALFSAGEVAGVSKTSQQREQRVSPEPEPEPVVATYVATPPGGVAPAARPSNGSEIPEKARHAGTLVGAYIDAYRETHGEKPTSGIIGRVSRDARRLLVDEHIPFERLSVAIREMGHAGFDDLERQLQAMARRRVRASPGRNGGSTTHFQNYDDPDDAYKDYEEQPSEVA